MGADARIDLDRFIDWCAASDFVNWSYGLPEGDKLAAIWLTCADLLVRRARRRDRCSNGSTALYELKPAIDLRVGAASAWGGKEALQDAKAALRVLRGQGEAVLNELASRPANSNCEPRD